MTSSRFTNLRVIFFRIILCSLIIGGGAYLMQSLILTRPLPQTSDGDEALPRVPVIRMELEELPQRWTGYGTVVAIDSANIPVRVNAIVKSVPDRIRNGAHVEVDEVIAVLDPADYQEQLTISTERLAQVDVGENRLNLQEKISQDRRDLALRDVELAEDDYERVLKAQEAGAALSREVDLVEQRLLQARQVVIIQDEVLAQIPIRRAELASLRLAEEAAVRVASLNVDRCTIKSPIAGILSSVNLEPGEAVLPGQPIARVVDVDHLEIPIHIASSARSDISVGDEITVYRPGQDRGFATQISRIAPVDDPTTRTFAVYVDINAADVDLAPGLFVRGEAVSGTQTLRTIIPRRAIRNQRIMLIEDGKMRTQPIITAFNVNAARLETGILDDEWAVLEENLPEGAYVVIEGSREIDEGAIVDVKVVNDAAERITP